MNPGHVIIHHCQKAVFQRYMTGHDMHDTINEPCIPLRNSIRGDGP